MSLFTLALLCYMLLCVYVSCNSFPEYVRKRPRLHDNVLGFARRPHMENALGFSLVSPILVNRRLRSAAWPPNRNRRSDLMHLLSRVCFCGLIGGYETAEWNPVLGMNSAVMIGGLAAEWNRRIRYFRSVSFSGSILRSHSAAPTAEWNRRLCVSRAKLSFHMPCFLML